MKGWSLMFSKNSKVWILVANRARGKLFQSNAAINDFRFLREIEAPYGRTKDKDFRRDQPGRSFDSFTRASGGHGTSSPRHSLGSELSQQDMAAIDFAKELAEILETGKISNQYDHLMLVSEPRFLGYLKGVLSEQVKDKIITTINKDYKYFPKGLK